MAMTEHVSRFVATTTSGVSVILLAFDHYKEIEDCSGPYRVLMGKSITTEDGQQVNYLEQGKFEISATRELLTSKDPACPRYE
jgi:hypothetical protein